MRGQKETKLQTRITVSFLSIIILPVLLMSIMFISLVMFQADAIQEKYGVDISHLRGFNRSMIVSVMVCLFIVLVITAMVLSLWLSRGINAPIQALTRAVRNIRDGNLDFELKPVGNVTEIRELFSAFEEMRMKLREANEEKIEFDRQNRELISNISHDLRTPITAVKGYCEGILDGVADTPEKRDRYIRTIYSKAIDMDRLINELSFYAKITTNRIPYTFERVNVRSFFDDAAEEIRDDLVAKGISFTYENQVGPDVKMIADIKQIQRVLNNLISNSVKYSDKPEPRIRLHVEMAGDEIRAALSDNGKGIAAKDLPNVFGRFYRADSSRHSAKGGSGIGLSIVKKIIEDHNGRVWVTSREGEGTTMYFALRRYEQKETP